MIVNLDFNLKDFAGKDMEEMNFETNEKETLKASNIVKRILAQSIKDLDPVTCMAYGLQLHRSGTMNVDEAHKKDLETILKHLETMNKDGKLSNIAFVPIQDALKNPSTEQ